MDEQRGSLSEPLIETNFGVSGIHQSPNQSRHRWRWYYVQFGLIAVNLILLAILIQKVALSTRLAVPHVSSPADDAIWYEKTYFNKYGHLTSPFSRKPGPELDAAWHQQLSGMNIRVPEGWLQHSGVDSIHLADGSGVLVQLGIYHELHCLKKIKHWIYRSHYSSNDSSLNVEEQEAHIEHCLEWLRVAALCRGDTTLTTFRWGGEGKGALETEYPVPRWCVNSDSLLAWSEQHAVDIAEPGLLKRPTS